MARISMNPGLASLNIAWLVQNLSPNHPGGRIRRRQTMCDCVTKESTMCDPEIRVCATDRRRIRHVFGKSSRFSHTFLQMRVKLPWPGKSMHIRLFVKENADQTVIWFLCDDWKTIARQH